MPLMHDAPHTTYIVQGEQALGFRPDHMVNTILGSCVSVCLWDSARSIGGMNHILLPEAQSSALGAGASACAVDGGRSIDTTMGLTPLEGLVMATRGGDVDPGVLLHLQRQLGYDADRLG